MISVRKVRRVDLFQAAAHACRLEGWALLVKVTPIRNARPLEGRNG